MIPMKDKNYTPCSVTTTKLQHFKDAIAYGGVKNYTPHAITVAGVTYPPCGLVARIDDEYSEIVDGTVTVKKGGLKFTKDGEDFHLCGYDVEGTVNLVSAMVFEVMRYSTNGCWVAPATGHPEVVRNDKGHIVSVPAFLI